MVASMGPRERFKRWFEQSGRTRADVGREIGCSGVYVGYLLSGDRKSVGLKVAFGIERITADWCEGTIAAQDWMRAESDGGEAAA